MPNQNTVEKYGWSNSEKVCAHLYLEPAILGACSKLGAKKILDLGCGNGALSRALFDAGFEVTGCDADNEGILLAKQANAGIIFKTLGVDSDPALLGDNDFDVVVSTEVVEHLFLPRHLPRFANAVLRKNGYLIVSTPYHGYLKNLVLSLLNKWDSHHDPLWDGGHIKFWSRSTLTRMLLDEGFIVREFIGAGRMPYLWKSMILVAQKA